MQQAGQYLGQKCKDVGAEANKEMEDDEKHKEQEYKAFESKHAGSTQNSQSQVCGLQGGPAPDGTTPRMEPIAHMDRVQSLANRASQRARDPADPVWVQEIIDKIRIGPDLTEDQKRRITDLIRRSLTLLPPPQARADE